MQSEVATQKAPVRHQQFIRGVVISDKMAKTRTVEIKSTKRHLLYLKSMVRKRKIMVHDEKNESHVGDLILAVSMRPLSKNKSFRLSKILVKKVTE